MSKPATPTEDRFWPKVAEQPNGCWLWMGFVNAKGYGQFRDDAWRGGATAHVIAYELVVGLVPGGLELDHLCRNRACVNPAHLEPVTRGENIRRGAQATVLRLGCCKRGHAMRGSNLYVSPVGKRFCRACRRDRDQRSQNRR